MLDFVTGEVKNVIATGDVELDDESDNSDCDSIATYSSGEIFGGKFLNTL